MKNILPNAPWVINHFHRRLEVLSSLHGFDVENMFMLRLCHPPHHPLWKSFSKRRFPDDELNGQALFHEWVVAMKRANGLFHRYW